MSFGNKARRRPGRRAVGQGFLKHVLTELPLVSDGLVAPEDEVSPEGEAYLESLAPAQRDQFIVSQESVE